MGFFYLVSHGIPRELLAQVYAEMAHFFHQPADEKRKVLANEYMRGYTLMNEETLDPDVQTQGTGAIMCMIFALVWRSESRH